MNAMNQGEAFEGYEEGPITFRQVFSLDLVIISEGMLTFTDRRTNSQWFAWQCGRQANDQRQWD